MGGGARSKRGGARLSYSECCPLLAFFLRLIGVALIQSSETTTKCESLDPSDVRTSMGEESVVPVPSGGSHHQRLSDYVVKTGLHHEFQHQAKSRDRLKRNIQKTHTTAVVSYPKCILYQGTMQRSHVQHRTAKRSTARHSSSHYPPFSTQLAPSNTQQEAQQKRLRHFSPLFPVLLWSTTKCLTEMNQKLTCFSFCSRCWCPCDRSCSQKYKGW